MRLWVTPLVCPLCGAAVPPRGHDALLVCAPCGVLHEVREGVPVALELGALPGASLGAWVRGLWCFDVAPRVAPGTPREEEVRAALPERTRLLVDGSEPYPAGAARLEGDLAPLPAWPEGMTLAPCPRSAARARAWLEPSLLVSLDREVDVTGVDLEVRVLRTRLALAPAG